jgi:hypothetical protein
MAEPELKLGHTGQANAAFRQTREGVLEAPASTAPGKLFSTPSMRYICYRLAVLAGWDPLRVALRSVCMDSASRVVPEPSPGQLPPGMRSPVFR